MKALREEVYRLERVLKSIRISYGENISKIEKDLEKNQILFYKKNDENIIPTYYQYRDYLREELNKYKRGEYE